jgi:hypothetical protein
MRLAVTCHHFDPRYTPSSQLVSSLSPVGSSSSSDRQKICTLSSPPLYYLISPTLLYNTLTLLVFHSFSFRQAALYQQTHLSRASLSLPLSLIPSNLPVPTLLCKKACNRIGPNFLLSRQSSEISCHMPQDDTIRSSSWKNNIPQAFHRSGTSLPHRHLPAPNL